MERDDILRVLRAHPDNCIRAFHRGAKHSTGRTEGRVLLCHYCGLVPDEITLRHVMFLKIQVDLCVTESWGDELLGGCTWRLRAAQADITTDEDLRAKAKKVSLRT